MSYRSILDRHVGQDAKRDGSIGNDDPIAALLHSSRHHYGLTVKAGRIGVDRCNRDRAIRRWLSSHDIRQQQPCDGKGEHLAHLLSLARFKAIAVGTVTNKLVYVAYGILWRCVSSS